MFPVLYLPFTARVLTVVVFPVVFLLDPLDLLSVVVELFELLFVLLSPVVSLVPSVVWLPFVV